jgi:hypothetical protein
MTAIQTPDRPIGVWLISLFVMGSGSMTLLAMYVIYFGDLAVPPATQAYLESLSFLEVSLSFCLGALNIGAAVSLFLLRKTAVTLFASALALNAVQTIWNLLFRDYLAAIGGNLFSVLLGLAIAMAITAYAWNLRTKAVLH